MVRRGQFSYPASRMVISVAIRNRQIVRFRGRVGEVSIHLNWEKDEALNSREQVFSSYLP